MAGIKEANRIPSGTTRFVECELLTNCRSYWMPVILFHSFVGRSQRPLYDGDFLQILVVDQLIY